MDTKSIKSRPFLVWLSFFLGLNIVAIMLVAGANYFSPNDIKKEIPAILKSDVKETTLFKENISRKFRYLAWYITQTDDADKIMDAREAGRNNNTHDSTYYEYNDVDHMIHLRAEVRDEGENLIYYALNTGTGKLYTNSESGMNIISHDSITLPEGYDYYLYYDGKKFIAQNSGQLIDIYRRDGRLNYNSFLWNYISDDPSAVKPDLSDCRILLIVRSNLLENPYGYSSLYSVKRETSIAQVIFIAATVIFLFGLGLLVIYLIKRNMKREFDRKLAYFPGLVWFEVKALLSICFIALLFQINLYNRWEYNYFYVIINFWWFYIIFNDLLVNRKKFFTSNSINWFIKKYRSFECKKPFQKAMLLRFYILISALMTLAFFTVILLCAAYINHSGFPFLFAVLLFAVSVYIIYRYLRRYNSTISDIDRLCNHIEAVRRGDLHTELHLNEGADMYFAAQNLNLVQQGFNIALEQKLKSERMKVDLITNVSHDLKTPLTSIISYVDLLVKEEGLPEHVKDYVNILKQKSTRLSTLITDIFDLSRATSNSMKINNEKLDLGRLIRQVLADLDERIAHSGLTFKINIPDEPLYILSDGSKLHRVFENLVLNALKYSIAGSRVFVQLSSHNGRAVVVIKNTANYEMDFDEETILQRFARGDKARTTEGSGLGLSIAQHFTIACGGEFNVKIDGDLFKVEINFILLQ